MSGLRFGDREVRGSNPLAAAKKPEKGSLTEWPFPFVQQSVPNKSLADQFDDSALVTVLRR